MGFRELSEQERKIYLSNLERQQKEETSLVFLLKYHRLMFEEGNYHNFMEKQKASKTIIEQHNAELETCRLAILDCKEKLEKGIETKEEQ